MAEKPGGISREDIRNELRVIMPEVFKYYKIRNEDNRINFKGYVLENLNKSKISFTSLESLNDPFEGVGSYCFDCQALDGLRNGAKIGEAVEGYLINKEFESLNYKYRILSLTANCRNSLMWSHYADSHYGICVGYDLDSLRAIEGCSVDKVKYVDTRPDIDEADDKNILIQKSRIWEYESEIRAIIPVDTPKYKTTNPEKYEDYIVYEKKSILLDGPEKVYLPKYVLKDCKIISITFGVRVTQEMIKEFKREFKLRESVDFYKIKYKVHSSEISREKC